MRRRWCLPLLLMALGCARGVTPPADLVLVNGRILTVDADDRVARAVAIRAGRIVAVGTDDDVGRFVGPGTRRIDLAGKAATPGLLDAHNHFAAGAIGALLEIDLSYPAVRNVADAVALVRDRVATTPAGTWVQGSGWDEGKIAERRLLGAADLDPVSLGHPVWLYHTTGHYGVANSAALALAKIDRATPDPPGGSIDRRPDGRPTGVLKEAAMDLVTRLIPGPTWADRVRAIAHLAREFNRNGMTAAKDPGIDAPTWEAYRAAAADGALTVRIAALWEGGQTEEKTRVAIDRVRAGPAPAGSMSAGPGPAARDRLSLAGIKLYADGSGGARTAWVWQEWNRDRTGVDRGNTGYPAYDPEILRRQIDMVHAAGVHVSVHAVGDRAIDWVVDSYAAALAATPTKGLRHGIIHANIPTDHAIETMARLQRDYDAGYPEPSAGFTWWIGDTYAGNFGVDRSQRLNPFRTYLDKGIRWANSSDYSVTPFPARYGLWAAMTREALIGAWGKTPFGTAESIGARDALRAQTIWVARQMFLEETIGSIEVGKAADLAVWDRDPYTVPAAEIKEMNCDLTIFDGRVIYERAAGG
jgi:hypothetical protein